MRTMIRCSGALWRAFFFGLGVLISAFSLSDAAEKSLSRGLASLDVYQGALSASSPESLHREALAGEKTLTGESDAAVRAVNPGRETPKITGVSHASSAPRSKFGSSVSRSYRPYDYPEERQGLSDRVKGALQFGGLGLLGGALTGLLIGLAVTGSVAAAPILAGAAVGVVAGAAFGYLAGLGLEGVKEIFNRW